MMDIQNAEIIPILLKNNINLNGNKDITQFKINYKKYYGMWSDSLEDFYKIFLNTKISSINQDFCVADFIESDIINEYSVKNTNIDISNISKIKNLCYIGRGHNGHEELVMDADENIYGCHEDSFYLIAESLENLIIKFCLEAKNK